jgi:hypothetical protein
VTDGDQTSTDFTVAARPRRLGAVEASGRLTTAGLDARREQLLLGA